MFEPAVASVLHSSVFLTSYVVSRLGLPSRSDRFGIGKKYRYKIAYRPYFGRDVVWSLVGAPMSVEDQVGSVTRSPSSDLSESACGALTLVQGEEKG